LRISTASGECFVDRRRADPPLDPRGPFADTRRVSLSDAIQLLRQTRKGPFTYDPNDPAYAQHWNPAPTQPGETVVRVVPGTARKATGGIFRPKQMVNARFTDQGRVYVDPIQAPRVGYVGNLAGRGLEAAGMTTPWVFEPGEAEVDETAQRISVTAPGLGVTLNPQRSTARPADLAPRDQIKNLMQMLKG
jgi:hypothetical protein